MIFRTILSGYVYFKSLYDITINRNDSIMIEGLIDYRNL